MKEKADRGSIAETSQVGAGARSSLGGVMSAEKGTLLIVDDEAEIREIIEINVSSLGYKVLEAGDGEQALEILRSHKVDVVVSDLMMPRMSGISLLTEMRDNDFMQPFIFVTAYPSQDSTIQALRLGAFDYVEKPFESEELRSLIVEAVRVSQEVTRLYHKGPAKSPEASSESAAMNEIRKLKTLRYSDSNSSAAKDDSSRERLLEIFVSEAMPQLLFCDAAIKGLENYDERSFELGYLFRVMQAIAAAAESIAAQNIVTVAKEAEKFYTALRIRPRSVNAEVIELAIRTNDVLKNLVNNLTKNFYLLSQDHESVVSEIKQKTNNLEAAA